MLMSTMLVELYDALKEAGASEAKARAAAESLVLGQDRLERIEEQTGKLPKIELDLARLDKDLAVVKAQIELLKWMNGIVIAGVLALIIKTFFT
jgi:lipid II:glycine glycyltransferase (peptidoglycan interpeptide bridge formation enzyme)